MSATEPIMDAEVVDAEPSTTVALRPVAPGSTELIRAATPRERVELARDMATELDAVIRAQGMRTKVGRSKVVKPDGSEVWEDRYHVNVEGWQTLATFLGLAVVPGDPEPIRDSDGRIAMADYEVLRERYPKGTTGRAIRDGSAQPEHVERAKVQGPEGFTCRTLVYKDGVLVGAGASRCTRREETWRTRDDFAIEGMAQTRSVGRAIAGAARWIVTLAGYNPTPAEEMPPPRDDDSPPAAQPQQQGPPFGPPLTQEHKAKYAEALKTLTTLDQNGLKALSERIKQLAGGYLPDLLAGVLTEVALSREPVPFDETPPVPEPEPPEVK